MTQTAKPQHAAPRPDKRRIPGSTGGSTGKGRNGRKGMGREERRDQLLRLSERVLARGGISALTMERLAAEARISKPIVYAHFRNRSELLVELFESYWSYVDALIQERRAGATKPRDFLARTVAAYLDAMEARGQALRQLLFKVLEDPLVEAARRERDRYVVNRWATTFFESNGVPRSRALCLGVMTRELLEATAIYRHSYDGKRRITEELFVETVANMLDANRT